MARLHCVCGKVLSNTLAPNDVQLWVYTDQEWDEMFSEVLVDPVNLPFPTFDVWRCTRCERVYVFKRGSDRAFKVYRLERNDDEKND